MLVVDPHRNEIKYQHFYPGSVANLLSTYRITHSDSTTFKGTDFAEGFIEVNRLTGATRIDNKPPTSSLYYDCKPTKPLL